MALDKDSREWIASDLARLTDYEVRHLLEEIDDPDEIQQKLRLMFLGSPQEHAGELLKAAKRRYWTIKDLNVKDGLRSLVGNIEQLETLIAELSKEGADV